MLCDQGLDVLYTITDYIANLWLLSNLYFQYATISCVTYSFTLIRTISMLLFHVPVIQFTWGCWSQRISLAVVLSCFDFIGCYVVSLLWRHFVSHVLPFYILYNVCRVLTFCCTRAGEIETIYKGPHSCARRQSTWLKLDQPYCCPRLLSCERGLNYRRIFHLSIERICCDSARISGAAW